MLYTRREIGKMALATLAVPGGLSTRVLAAQLRDATINGVTVGVQTYSFRAINNPATQIITAMRNIGLFEAELMSGDAENLAGMPSVPSFGRGGGGGRGGGRGRGQTPLTPEQQAQRDEAIEAQRKWRLSTSPGTWAAVRQQFNDAGIDVRFLCYNMGTSTTDETMEYAFSMAKGLGVKAITSSTQISTSKRIAPFADKHKMLVGVHGHASVNEPDEISTEATFLAAMAHSEFIAANLDIGHYVAAGGDPVDFLNKHHARVTNLHLKDRARTGGNFPFGSGETPIRDVLQLLKTSKWDIPANIEFEYPGDPLVEVPKCLEYIKAALA